MAKRCARISLASTVWADFGMRFHAVAGRLVRDAPAMLQPREAIRGLENAVIEVLACCLLGDELPGETVGQRQFHRLLADNPFDTPVLGRCL